MALCFLASVGALGQRKICIDSNIVSTYQVDNYRVEDGLSQNTVKSMAKDGMGFLWISTEKGLSRFDGTTFKNYLGRPFKIGLNRMSDIYKSEDSLFFRGRPHMVAHNGQLIYDTTRNFTRRHILGQHSQHYNRSTDPFEGRSMIAHPGSFTIQIFYLVGNGDFYANDGNFNCEVDGERDYRLYYYKNGKKAGGHKYLAKFIDNTLNHFFVLDGKLCSLFQGVIRVFDQNRVIDSLDLGFTGDEIDIHWNDGERGVYLNNLTTGDIYRLDDHGPQHCLKLIIHNSEVRLINSIIEEDESGIILIGSMHEGLYKFRRKSFENWSSGIPGRTKSVVSAFQIGSDSLLSDNQTVLTPDTSYILDVSNRLSLKKFLSKPSDEVIRYPDSILLLASTPSGVKAVSSPFWLQNHLTDQNGITWALIRNKLHRFLNDEWERVPMKRWADEAYTYDNIFYSPSDNEIWLGLYQQAIIERYDPTTNEVQLLEGLPEGGEIKFIHFDRSGLQFIRIGDEGFFIYQKGIAIRMPVDPNNYLQYAHCIVEDKAGFFWISSDHGLFKVLRQDLLDHFQDRQKKVYYHYYDKNWGFLNNEFNGRGFPCGITMSNGKIAFPSFEGMVVFDPYEVGSSRQSGLIIDDILIDGVDTSFEDGLYLDQNYADLEVQLAQSFYGHPDNTYLEYQLDGYHKDWRRVPEDMTLRIQRLNFGDYTLLIRKLKGHGRDNLFRLELPITVSRMYFETAWFISGVILLIVALTAGIVFWRSRRARRKRLQLEAIIDEKTRQYRTLNTELRLSLSRLRTSEREQKITMKFKDRMMAIYTHDIRGPLRFISSMAHDSVVALGKLKQEDVKRYFGMIEEASHKVFLQTERMFNISNLDDQNISIRPEAIDLYKSIDQCLSTFMAQASEKKITLINDTSEQFVILAETNVLDIILNNIVQNAMKYTSEGSIRFISSHLKDYTVLSISDTGTGMDQERLDQLNDGEYWSKPGTAGEPGMGFGLKVVKDFLRKLEGHMEIESEPGKGTTVNIFFKRDTST